MSTRESETRAREREWQREKAKQRGKGITRDSTRERSGVPPCL